MNKIAVALLSGGLDSAVTMAIVQNEGYEVRALSFDYGQRHRRELESAMNVCDAMKVPQTIVSLPGLGKLASASALTDLDVDLPVGPFVGEGGVPLTYVPMRNSTFLALAASMLESWWLDAPDDAKPVQCAIAIGANAVDYSGYPDCRPDYLLQMEEALTLGSSLWAAHDRQILIEAPLVDMTKVEIIEAGRRLNVPLELTRSCYSDAVEPCGLCYSCQIRDEGMRDAAP